MQKIALIGTLLLMTCHLVQASEQERVATVAAEVIYAHELEPPEQLANAQNQRLDETEYKKWRQDIRIMIFKRRIWSALENYFLAKESIGQPTDSEIDSFIAFSEKASEKHRLELPKQLETILNELNSEGLSEEKREQLIQHQKTVETLIGYDRAEQAKTSDPEYMAMKKQSMQEVARITVRTWKFNRALYQRYGGRVIFQQAGYEPIDAYKSLWDEIGAGEYITVHDPNYQDALKDQQTEFKKYYELGHNYVDKAPADFYFEIPWWQRSEEEWKQFE